MYFSTFIPVSYGVIIVCFPLYLPHCCEHLKGRGRLFFMIVGWMEMWVLDPDNPQNSTLNLTLTSQGAFNKFLNLSVTVFLAETEDYFKWVLHVSSLET